MKSYFRQPTAVVSLLVVFAAALFGMSTSVSAHMDGGEQLVGPGRCGLDYTSNHNAAFYSVETTESTASAAPPAGCSGVKSLARYLGWDYQYYVHISTDVGFPYQAYANGTHAGDLDWAAHQGRDYQNGVWYQLLDTH